MLLKVLIFLLFITGLLAEEETGIKSKAHTYYDQRQTGKYNLNVNIKDVQVFSLEDSLASIGDYGSYDYEDDYATADYDDGHL